jgi:tetratricopeptide (TPR) repeat protein
LKIESIFAILLVGLLLALPAVGQKSANELINEGNDLSHNKVQYEESLKLFDEAITLEPNNGYAWSGKGYVFIYLGKYKDAMNCFDKCVELDPNNAWFWDCKAYVHDYLGEFEEALKCYNRSLEINPSYATALDNKGWTLFRQGKYEDAVLFFDMAAKTYSNSVSEWSSSWAGQGLALKAQDKNDEAKNCFNLALESSNEEMKKLPSLIVYAWEGRGLAFYGLGRLDESIECLGKALELNPRFAECWYWKGLVHLDLNQDSEARLAFEKAKEIGLAWPIPDIHPPDLSDAKVTPDCGQEKSDDFNFTVVYKDEYGDEPAETNIAIRGWAFDSTRTVYNSDYNDMTKVSGNANQGAVYSFKTQLPERGEYNYTFYFTNSKGVTVRLPKNGFEDNYGLPGPKVGIECKATGQTTSKVVITPGGPTITETLPILNLKDAFTISSQATSEDKQLGYFEIKINKPEMIEHIEITAPNGKIEYVLPLGGPEADEIVIKTTIGVAVEKIPVAGTIVSMVLEKIYDEYFRENRNNVDEVDIKKPGGVWLVKVRPAAIMTIYPDTSYFHQQGWISPEPLSRSAPLIIPGMITP